MNLVGPRASARVLRYFAQVTLNGALYSRVAAVRRYPARRSGEVLAGDWVLVGALAAQGSIRTLEDVHIVRSLSGISTDATALAEREFGRVGPIERHAPHVVSGVDRLPSHRARRARIREPWAAGAACSWQ